MATDSKARLDSIRREIDLQNRGLAQSKESLFRESDMPRAIPQEWFDEMDRLVVPTIPSRSGIRA